MTGLLSYIAAGAAAGVGQGLVQNANAMREQALKQLEIEAENQRDANTIADTTTDDQGNAIGITKSGQTKRLGFKTAMKPEDLVQTVDPTTGKTVLTPKSKAAGMEVPSKPDTISRTVLGDDGSYYGITGSGKSIKLNVKGKQAGTGQPDKVLVQVWDDASKQNVWLPRSQAIGKAAPHTSQQTTTEGGLSDADNRLLSFVTKKHTTKDPDTGDETTDWDAVAKDLNARGRKDLADLAGNPDAADDGTDTGDGSAAAASQASGSGHANAATVKGSGTQADPYTPTTQADFDSIPAGMIYRNPADGKLYKKKAAAPGK